MTHDQADALLAAYVDSELGPSSAVEVAEHLRSCEACREEYALMQEMRMAVRVQGRCYRAPSDLRAAYATGERARKPSWLERLFGIRWAGPAFAAGLAAVVSSVLTLELVTPAVPNRVAEELISNHVRSLMTQHLLDVPSTDKHTVKPWFAGRIDFSPPVEDFSSNGFRLAGGRLEYVEERPVAALVYQHGKHFINVYIRPNERGRASDLKAVQHHGYSLLDWSDSRFTYDIVSDANVNELRDLESDLAAVSSTP